jgi:Holliday junction resolvasome RuvABC endonuclease subunit
VPLASQLNASATSQQIDTAVSRVLYMMQPQTHDSAAQLGVRFTHNCR